MNYQMVDLVWARVKAFAVQALSLLLGAILVAVANTLESTAFTTLIVDNFGEFAGAGLGMMIITAITSHLHNLRVVKDYQQKVGSGQEGNTPPPVLI